MQGFKNENFKNDFDTLDYKDSNLHLDSNENLKNSNFENSKEPDSNDFNESNDFKSGISKPNA